MADRLHQTVALALRCADSVERSHEIPRGKIGLNAMERTKLIGEIRGQFKGIITVLDQVFQWADAETRIYMALRNYPNRDFGWSIMIADAIIAEGEE